MGLTGILGGVFDLVFRYHLVAEPQRKAYGIVYGEEETDWFQLEMWNRDAEYAAKICSKGGRVGVQVSCL